MVIYVMAMIIAVGRNIKYTMELTLWMMPLNKVTEIKYLCEYLNQPMAQKIL